MTFEGTWLESMGFYNEYYEQDEFWDKDYLTLPAERQRILEAIALIASLGVSTILDVGCGNGGFLHALPKRYKAVGIDISMVALQHVRSQRIRARSSALPFPDASFDLVTSFEVLEHLPYREFANTVSELRRVAKDFIMVSVPNAEELVTSLVVCPECQCRFNPYRHVRAFDKESLGELFPGFRLVELREVGPLDDRFYSPVVRLRRLWSSPPAPLTSICPQCGYSPKVHPGRNVDPVRPRNPVVKAVKTLARAILGGRRRLRRWLLALYAKRES